MSSLRTMALAVAMICLASCAVSDSDSESTEPEIRLNQTQAVERIKEHIEVAVSDFSGEIELSPVETPTFPSCEGEPGDDNHTVTARHVYWVDGVSEEKNEELAEYIHDYWSSENWAVTTDKRPEKLYVEARNRDDQFRMNLVVNEDGRPSLAAYSPCVQADDKQ